MRATLESLTRERFAPGEAAVAVTIANDGDRPTPFHEHRAQHASLVLQVEDPSGRRVLLPPPSPPDEQDLAPARTLAPGESVTLRYVGFLDTYATGGRYRVRWFSPHDDLGGTRESPLASDWVTLDVAHRDIRVEIKPSFLELLFRPISAIARWITSLYHLIWVVLCRSVQDKEVDRFITETISDGYPTSWNGTYSWSARFHVRLDQPQERIFVTIRIRPVNVAATTAAPWITTVQNAWTNRFKDCATLGCASNGYPILLAVQFVTSGEHHAVALSPTSQTQHMLSWGLLDTDQAHEAGHMLGNKEEYFTVDGVAYGPGRQPSGNIMNNPANPPIAAHYCLIQETVDAMLGINYSLAGGSMRSMDTPCGIA